MTHENPVPWHTFAADAPQLARDARAQFESARHHVLASLRKDGSPRVSGTEVQFHADDLVVGMMHRSIKALDLQRDGRFALHAAMTEPMGAGAAGGDVKISGTATEITDDAWIAGYVDAVQPPPPFHVFRLAIAEVIRTSMHPDGDRLVVERWTPAGGLSRTERS